MVDIDPDQLPEGAQKRAQVTSMFDAIAPRYDLVNRIMTFGLDVRWRRATVRRLGLAPGSTIVDLACGTGDFCRDLDRAALHPVGMDLSMGMLREARTDAPLVNADVLSLPLPDGGVDGVTCGFALRNFVELHGFFDELARVVRPGGRIALLEVAEPTNRALRRGHGIYFGSVVPFIGGVLSDRTAYQYLPKSVAYLPAAPVLEAAIAEAGFTPVEHTRLSGGIAQLFLATRR